MKTIKRQEEIAFNALTFKDAIIMLPLIDALTKAVNYNRVVNFYNTLPKEEKDKYRRMWHQSNLEIPAESMEEILQLLTNLGFESQINLKEPDHKDLSINKA